MPPAVTAAARRAQRIIESDSDSPAADEVEDNVDEEGEDENDDEEEGEDEEDEEEMDVDEDADDSEHLTDPESEAESPAPRKTTIRLRVTEPPTTRRGRSSASAATRPPATKQRGSTRAAAIKASARAVAQQAKEKAEEEEEDDDDELSEADELEDEAEAEAEEVIEVSVNAEDDEEEDEEDEGGDTSRAASPSKMTARQRARFDMDTGEHLLALPDGINSKAKPELTEAERLQKREEMARRRKRQNEQRLQDEQDQTINRLLRAQTGRSRSKLDDTETPRSGQVSPVKQRAPVPDGIRWVSRMKGESVVLSIGVKRGREAWIAVGEEGGAGATKKREDGDGKCAAQGCGQARKYRCVAKRSVGGCSVAHLKEVEGRVKAGEL